MVAGPRQVVVTSTAQELINYSASRSSLTISNLGSVPIYWGRSATMTTTTGMILRAGATTSFNKGLGDNPKIAMFFIADSSVSMAIDEQGANDGD